MAPSQTQAAGGAEILSGEETPESRAGAEPEVSVWSLAKGGSGRVGFAGGGPSSSEGFASLGPAPPGAVLEGARSREADALRAQWQPAPGTLRVSHRRLSSSQSGCPEPGGVLH